MSRITYDGLVWIKEVDRPNSLYVRSQIAKSIYAIPIIIDSNYYYSTYLVANNVSWIVLEERSRNLHASILLFDKFHLYVDELINKMNEWFQQLINKLKFIVNNEVTLEGLKQCGYLEIQAYSWFHLKTIISLAFEEYIKLFDKKQFFDMLTEYPFLNQPYWITEFRSRINDLRALKSISLKSRDVLLEKHINDYKWFYFTHYRPRLSNYNELLGHVDKNYNDYDNYKTMSIQIDPDMRDLINIYQKILYLFEQRLIWIFKSQSEIYFLLKNIATTYDVKIDFLLGCTLDSIVDLVAGNNYDRWNIDMRNTTIYVKNRKTYIFDNSKCTALPTLPEENIKRSIFSGTPVYPGLIHGKAVVIQGQDVPSIIDKESILIAPMVTPRFIELINKAVGVITEEGGMLSHAATLCREFKVISITDVPNITKYISNGELIQMDAYNGTITKIGNVK